MSDDTYGPEWREAVSVSWRLDQIGVRLYEIRRHFEELLRKGELPPKGITPQIAAARRVLDRLENRMRGVSSRHHAYQRRVSGVLTKNEEFDQKHGRDPKSGMKAPE